MTIPGWRLRAARDERGGDPMRVSDEFDGASQHPGFVAVDSPRHERPVGERGDEWHAARSEPHSDRASYSLPLRTTTRFGAALARVRAQHHARARVEKSHAAAQRRGSHEVPSR